ncbi:OLC1v1018703C1 [Oldenlandia corymbosa var. corymbosa]|uniref:OLC1v1018703C1 n=1 Tax=Oldenlandia corymbosa var. corymbosa TaxID=529605 RepID=A0AAV1ECJ9_OLDCO|nr:OLC1v1018703C1 [Oldenlandia corymbosa var. corymbosa]
MANPSHGHQCVDFLTNLPTELVEEIMMRVDLPTVGRARCVQKSWRAMWSYFDFCFRFCKEILPITSQLVCMRLQSQLVILNPQTGQQCIIPAPFCPSLLEHYWTVTFDYIDSMAIYCIVALRQLPNGRMYAKYLSWMPYESLNGVVYGSWKVIYSLCPRVVMPEGLFVGDTVYWCINKLIHWPVIQINRRELLIAFSCSSQTFNIIQSPNDERWKMYPFGFHNSTKLLNLMGKLCIVDEEFISLTALFQVWELRNDGEENLGYHWRKLRNVMLDFTPPTVPGLMVGPFMRHWKRPVFLCPKSSDKGDFVVAGPDRYQFYIYNPVKSRFTLHVKPGMIQAMDHVAAGFFWRSLVRI